MVHFIGFLHGLGIFGRLKKLVFVVSDPLLVDGSDVEEEKVDPIQQLRKILFVAYGFVKGVH